MSPPTHSHIWTYFEPNLEDRDKADCKICKKSYSRKGRTTSSLKNHLKSMHPEEFSIFESMGKEIQLQKIKSEADEVATPLQEVKEQFWSEEVFLEENKWDTNNLNSNKIDKLIGEMIALQNLPFNFVEGLGFRRLIQGLVPRYNFRGRHFFTDFVCKELYGKIAQKVKELIENFDYMSFTCHIWSAPSSNASLLSLTCHGIEENFVRTSLVLKCETFDGRHTGDIISQKFNTMLSEWNIKIEQVHCLIRGEESNMKSAIRLPALNVIDCTVYKIQLAIRSCLGSEDIKILIQKCKNISSHFNHSNIAQRQLQTIQDRLNQPHHQVFQDCVTPWDSTFSIFERFSKVKDALNLYINDNEVNPILPEEWKIIERCIHLLRPFEEATRELSSSHALISSVIPIIHILKKKVDDYLTKSQEFDPIRQSVTTLKNELSTKFSSLGANNLYIIATYLDPRFKNKFFTPVTEEKIKNDILMMTNTKIDFFGSRNTNSEGAKRMRMTDSADKDMGLGPGTSGYVRNPCLKNDLAMLLDSSSEDESQEIPENCSTKAVLKKELLSYHTKKIVKVDENPLKWWNIHREEFQLLSPIARRFLSTPPGSVPNEQLFSSTGLIHESEKAAILLFIKYNAPIFNFTY